MKVFVKNSSKHLDGGCVSSKQLHDLLIVNSQIKIIRNVFNFSMMDDLDQNPVIVHHAKHCHLESYKICSL